MSQEREVITPLTISTFESELNDAVGLERNDSAAIQHLFTFDSDTLRGGTGEIRAWITVAGAMQCRATVVDYIRAHHSKVGLAFAYWPSVATMAATPSHAL